MSRKISTDLFDLIRSLKKSEKRYFKLFSERHVIGESNKYVILFDAIEKQTRVRVSRKKDGAVIQEEYNEEKLLLKNPGISPHLLPDQKTNLYELLLKSLSIYHSNENIEYKLRGLLSHVDLLTSKLLFTQSKKVLKKAKQLAHDHGHYLILLEILGKERKILFASFNLKTAKKELDTITAEETRFFELHNNLSRYKQLSESIYLMYCESFFQKSKMSKSAAVKKNFDASLLEDERKALSYFAKHHFYKANCYYAIVQQDFQKFYSYCKKSVIHLELNPALIDENPRDYIVALQNLLIAQKNVRKFDESLIYFKKLKSLRHVGEDLAIELFKISTDIELTTYIDSGEFHLCLIPVKRIETELKKYQKKLRPISLAIMYFNMTYIYIANGHFRQAFSMVNKIISNISMKTSAPTEYAMAKLVALIIYYELKYYDLIESEIHSTYYLLRKKDEVSGFESDFIDFIKKAIVLKDHKEFIDLCRKMHKEALRIEKDPLKNKAFRYFDFTTWFETKFSNKSFEGIVKEKLKRAS
jgi:hypothetical protein